VKSWQRVSPMSGIPGVQSAETWVCTDLGGHEAKYPMRVTNGKPFDVLSLKGTKLSDVRDYAAFLERTAARLYASGAPRRRVSQCPCCLAETAEHARQTYQFFDVPFYRCAVCGNGFVLEQPSEAVLNSVFAESGDHSSVYVDRASLETRMREIIAPKLAWVLDVYDRHHGGKPRHGLDVGAGGGHFVAAMGRAGLDGTGFELSTASRAFAAEAFGISLREEDFLRAPPRETDLMTFWGLLEYTPEPRRFLETARKWLAGSRGLLVIEVPRLECLGTAAQAQNPRSIARHMDPTSHVNTFSDAALATALVETGFTPVAAWYFGMDVYELLVQTALRLNDVAAIERMADMIPALQATLDHGRQCDDIVIAALPQG
jgi:hypothetical protein